MIRFSPRRKTNLHPLPKLRCKTSRIRNFSALSACAVISTYGLLHLLLNTTGQDYLLRYLINEGNRIYPDGFESSRHFADASTIDAVQTVERFLDDVPCDGSWTSKNCYENVVLLAKERQKKGTVVLAVATAGKYGVALNWCASLLRLEIDNFMIVALDTESFEFFSSKGAPVMRLAEENTTSTKKDIWIRRSLLTYMILRSGINVLVSDFDAISVRSPFKSRLFNFEDSSVDIITTPSNFPNPDKNELPGECPKPRGYWSGMEWTHQPCMGWTFFRSSPRLRTFFEEKLLYDVLKFKDDQIGFNCAIRRAGAIWREPRKGMRWKGMLTYMVSPKLTILMLPASRYVRNCASSSHSEGRKPQDLQKVEMYHCKGYGKEENAKNHGFWFLRDDWESVKSSEALNFSDYMTRISNSP